MLLKQAELTNINTMFDLIYDDLIKFVAVRNY